MATRAIGGVVLEVWLARGPELLQSSCGTGNGSDAGCGRQLPMPGFWGTGRTQVFEEGGCGGFGGAEDGAAQPRAPEGHGDTGGGSHGSFGMGIQRALCGYRQGGTS